MPDESQRTGTVTVVGRLMERVRAGDVDARKELLARCYERFRERARLLLNRQQFRDLRNRGLESGDVVNQAILERLFKENGKGLLERQEFSDPRQFLGAVAVHMEFCLKDIAKGRGGGALRQHHQKTNKPTTGGMQLEDNLSARTDRDAAILDAIEALDDKDREVFRLRYIVGLSREEVAEHLNVSTKYVSRHARKAKEVLADRIRNEEQIPD